MGRMKDKLIEEQDKAIAATKRRVARESTQTHLPLDRSLKCGNCEQYIVPIRGKCPNCGATVNGR